MLIAFVRPVSYGLGGICVCECFIAFSMAQTQGARVAGNSIIIRPVVAGESRPSPSPEAQAT